MRMHEIDGILVESYQKEGREVIIGMSTDPQFGPILMFGLGGIYVEALKDVAFRVHPVNRIDAEEMIRAIRGFPLLEGVRGEEGVDLDTLAEMIQRVSQLIGRPRSNLGDGHESVLGPGVRRHRCGCPNDTPVGELSVSPLLLRPVDWKEYYSDLREQVWLRRAQPKTKAVREYSQLLRIQERLLAMLQEALDEIGAPTTLNLLRQLRNRTGTKAPEDFGRIASSVEGAIRELKLFQSEIQNELLDERSEVSVEGVSNLPAPLARFLAERSQNERFLLRRSAGSRSRLDYRLERVHRGGDRSGFRPVL